MFRHEFAPARQNKQATKSADFVQPGDLNETPSWANDGLEPGHESTAKVLLNPALPTELSDFVPFDEVRPPTDKDYRQANRENNRFDRKAFHQNALAEAEALANEDPAIKQQREDEFVASVREYKRMQGLDQGIRYDQKEAQRKQNRAAFKAGAVALKNTLKEGVHSVALNSIFVGPVLEQHDDLKRQTAARHEQEKEQAKADKKDPGDEKNPGAADRRDEQTIADLAKYRKIEAAEKVRREKEAAQKAAEKQAAKTARVEAAREKARLSAEKKAQNKIERQVQASDKRRARRMGHATLKATE